MSGEWTNLWDWAAALVLLAAWLLYSVLRPVRDYYVLQRFYFDRIYEHPWRGKLFGSHYHGFTDYLPAKAAFQLYEVDFMSTLDDGQNEAEHSLFMVPAKSKSAAMGRLKSGKAFDKELLHKTPIHDILKRRAYWQKAVNENVSLSSKRGES